MTRDNHLKGKKNRTDFSIENSINVNLFRENVALYFQICLKVFEGDVLLACHVPTKELKEKARKIAQKTPGVRRVLDNTSVGTSREISQYSKDNWIATQFGTKVYADGKLLPGNYLSEVSDGVVYLLGRARDAVERKKVIDIARGIPGVKKVISYIRIEK